MKPIPPVDLVDPRRRLETGIPAPQVEQAELLRGGGLVFRLLDVDAANPITTLDKVFRQVVADKSAGTRHGDAQFSRHALLLLRAVIL
jgi:hypothetical protein